MARLLFLGASVSQLPAIRYAKENGHWVAACDGDDGAIGFSLCDAAEAIDFSDVVRVEEAARRLAVQGILAVCTDRAVIPAATVAANTGLAGIGVDVATAMTHKPTMRRRLREAAVAQPAFVVVRDAAELQAARTELRFPAVLKPADSGGQRGLFVANTFEEAREQLPLSIAASRRGEVIVEEFVSGSELNALIAVRGGVPKLLTLSDRLRPDGPGFGVGWIHSFPSALPPDVLARAAETACAAVEALGLRDGIAFPQLIAGPKRVVVVEVAARIAAGQMADLVRLGTGIELYEIAIRQALGNAVPDELVTPVFERPIAIRFLTASPGVLPVGTVTWIDGLNRVRSSEGVLDCGLYFTRGAEIRPVQVDADRMGYVIATAETPAQALRQANRAAKKLTIEVDAPHSQRAVSRHRAMGWLGVAATLALLCGTIAAFTLAERAKLAHPLVLGTRVDGTFSPTCACSRSRARIVFRLARRALVSVGIVDAGTHLVDTLLPLRRRAAGWVHLLWNGRTATGDALPDGTYRPQVRFPALRRTLVLPSPINLDTDPPRIESVATRITGGAVTVRYRLGERAQAELLVDGRRVVLTRRSTPTGTLSWSDRLADQHPLGPGAHTVTLAVVDLAGNRSRPRALGTLVLRRG